MPGPACTPAPVFLLQVNHSGTPAHHCLRASSSENPECGTCSPMRWACSLVGIKDPSLRQVEHRESRAQGQGPFTKGGMPYHVLGKGRK